MFAILCVYQNGMHTNMKVIQAEIYKNQAKSIKSLKKRTFDDDSTYFQHTPGSFRIQKSDFLFEDVTAQVI